MVRERRGDKSVGGKRKIMSVCVCVEREREGEEMLVVGEELGVRE